MIITFLEASKADRNKTKMATSGHKLAASIGRNTIFGIISRLAQVATRLVTIPIVISHLGLGGYGIWAIIMTAAAYMRFGSVGVKSAFQKYVAEATGDGDFETTNKLLSTGCAVMLVLSVAVLIPVAWFSTALAKAAGVPPEFLHSAAGATSVLALIMVLSNVGAVYEAIVMGGHRIDLARNFATAFTVAEAVAIVILLHFGYGLLAMASVMAASEVGFVLCCYVSSKRILPQVRVSRLFVTMSVVPELLRFAGSYQLVSVLEVLYGSILPVAVLRVFGVDACGIYALAIRLVSSAVMLPDALLLPILSGGAMVYASGSQEGMLKLIAKSFKITLGLSLFPLGFIAAFGSKMVFAWTGQTDPSLRTVLWLVCAAGFFQAFSILGLVLYRASGKALFDNLRQVVRIVFLFSIAMFARQWGFYNVLAGFAFTEFIGMVFMLFAITKTFHAFRPQSLVPDALKLTAATAAVLVAGALATRMPLPAVPGARLQAVLEMGRVSLGCVLAVWPALWLTQSVTDGEGKTIMSIFLPKRTSCERRCAEDIR